MPSSLSGPHRPPGPRSEALATEQKNSPPSEETQHYLPFLSNLWKVVFRAARSCTLSNSWDLSIAGAVGPSGSGSRRTLRY
jgi:hypothetical protein